MKCEEGKEPTGFLRWKSSRSGDKRERDRSREGVCAHALDFDRGFKEGFLGTDVDGRVGKVGAASESTPSLKRRKGLSFSNSAFALAGGAFGGDLTTGADFGAG